MGQKDIVPNYSLSGPRLRFGSHWRLLRVESQHPAFYFKAVSKNSILGMEHRILCMPSKYSITGPQPGPSSPEDAEMDMTVLTVNRQHFCSLHKGELAFPKTSLTGIKLG